MKKVLESAVIAEVEKIMKKGTATDIVKFITNLQDASGLKICQNADSKDAAYREIK